MGSRPAPSGPANAGQACVKGRFAVRDIAANPKRLTRPLIRRNGRLVPAEWDEALAYVAEGLRRFRPGEVAFQASDQMTVEDAVLFAALERRFHGAAGRGGPSSAGPGGVIGFDRADIGSAGTVVLLGLDLPVSHPMAWLEVVKAVRRGAALAVIDTGGTPPFRRETLRLRAEPAEAARLLADISEPPGRGAPPAGTGSPEREALRELLRTRPPAVLLYDADGAPEHRIQGQPGVLRAFPLVGGINANGLRAVGIRPSAAASAGPVRALFALGPGPAPGAPRCDFLVLETCFLDEGAPEADAVLPAASFLETSGTYINLEGRTLTFERVLDPPGQARPDGWILRELARKLGIEDLGVLAEAVPAESLRAASGPDLYRGLDLARNIKGLGMLRAARRERIERGR
jgi:anaerobic selenocysteine-containing dehydrogenase